MTPEQYLSMTKQVADRPLVFRSIVPEARLCNVGDEIEVDVRGLLFVMVSAVQEVDSGTCHLMVEGTIGGNGWNLIDSLTEDHFGVGPKQAATVPVSTRLSVVHYSAVRVRLRSHRGLGEYSVEVAGFKVAETE